MKGLTDKQQEILDFISEFARKEGMAPTIFEISERFKIKSATAFASAGESAAATFTHTGSRTDVSMESFSAFPILLSYHCWLRRNAA